MDKKPVTKIVLNTVTVKAEDGYALTQEGDTISVIKRDRYVLYNGRYSQHFKDAVTGDAVSLEKVLNILNGRE